MTDPGKTRRVDSSIDKTISLDNGGDRSNYVEVEIGSILANRYKIDAKIGEGGMGMVYHGHDEQLQQDVALKLLKKNMSVDESAVEKLKQEAQVAMMLTHPYIMRLINFERDGEYAFLLMEFVEGETLDSLAGKSPGGRLDEQLVAMIGYKVCQALEYAHDKNVIHRDIKPANIMITEGGEGIKLMDFGIARTLLTTSDEKHQIAGTLAYIAPEVFEGAPLDPRADIYALGLTLYELLAGGHPFQGNTAKEIIRRHFKMKPQPLENVSKRLASIIFQCVEKKPNARFQTAKELKSALAKFLDLDEGAKVTRMKAQLEYEKRKMDTELRRLEREKKRLESERKDMRRELTRSRINRVNSAAIGAYGANREKSRLKLSPELPGVAVVSAIAAVFIGAMISEGEVMDFETEVGYGAAAAMFICALVVAIPALVKNGVSQAVVGAVVGGALGYVGFMSGENYIEYSLEHDALTHFTLVSYLATAIPVAVAAASTQFPESEASKSLTLLVLTVVAAVLSAFVPYLKLAEEIFGFGMETSAYFYTPFLAAVVWSTVGLWESAQDG